MITHGHILATSARHNQVPTYMYQRKYHPHMHAYNVLYMYNLHMDRANIKLLCYVWDGAHTSISHTLSLVVASCRMMYGFPPPPTEEILFTFHSSIFYK